MRLAILKRGHHWAGNVGQSGACIATEDDAGGASEAGSHG